MAAKTLRRRRKVSERRAVQHEDTRRLVDDVFLIDRMLQRSVQPTLAEIARELELHTRTVQRRLELMRDRLMLDIVTDPETRRLSYKAGVMKVPATHLSDDELIALYVAEPILAQYRGTELEGQFRRAFERLMTPLPAKVRARLEPVGRRISVKAVVPAKPQVEHFRTLMNATFAGHQLRLTYYSAHRGSSTVRDVDPYALRCVDGQWYLLAYCHQRHAVLPFLLTRIWSAGETKKRFEYPQDFDAERFLQGSLGIYKPPLEEAELATAFEVVLRFDPFAARYADAQRWHASQSQAKLSDGSVEVRFKLESSVELERFVLSWGEHVEVLEPASLRERMRGRLERTLAKYEAKPA